MLEIREELSRENLIVVHWATAACDGLWQKKW